MAAVQEGVNFFRIFFYAKNTISAKRKKALVALAYQTARDQLLALKKILIRSDLHGTTSIKGRRIKDPKGWHGTFAFKSEDQLLRQYHVASHGYTNSKEEYILQEATHSLSLRAFNHIPKA